MRRRPEAVRLVQCVQCVGIGKPLGVFKQVPEAHASNLHSISAIAMQRSCQRRCLDARRPRLDYRTSCPSDWHHGRYRTWTVQEAGLKCPCCEDAQQQWDLDHPMQSKWGAHTLHIQLFAVVCSMCLRAARRPARFDALPANEVHFSVSILCAKGRARS